MKTTTDTTLCEVESAEALPKSSLARLIAEHPFLQGMKPEHLAILAECAMLAEFKKGEMIFREGDPLIKAPKTKHQTPKKLQVPSSKAASLRQVLGFEVWDFSGAWCLGFGVSFSGLVLAVPAVLLALRRARGDVSQSHLFLRYLAARV